MIGWQILCPDGKERHYPYINQGDAECDAALYSERGCRSDPDMIVRHGPCPEGRHVLAPAVFTLPEAPGVA